VTRAGGRPPEVRRVLHVLPHPGAGGERYVDALGEMEGYRFERVYLAQSANPADERRAILRRAVQVQRTARSHDLLHVVGEIAASLCLPGLATRPSVVSPQGLHLVRRVRGAARAAANANLRMIVRVASRTICSSEDEYAEVRRIVGHRLSRRALVIHNGVRTNQPVQSHERAAARAEFGLAASDVAGVWIASLDEHKDPDTAIRAAKQVRRDGAPLALLVAGDGPLRSLVEQLAGEDENSGVSILGFRRDVRRVLAAADFFVLTSMREGLSFSLLEAMALGVPAVVSDAPANAEAVGDAGLVVPYGQVNGFAEAFARLVKDRERLALGQRARERVERQFRVEDMVKRTRDVYDVVVRGRGPSLRR
jgi:glycosyltransferase involved in cell wall biosynthesis